MTVIDRRVSNGGGSCARCRGCLDLTAVSSNGDWFCSPCCRDGESAGANDTPPRSPQVPEPWLYARPRRFFGKRRPKELRSR